MYLIRRIQSLKTYKTLSFKFAIIKYKQQLQCNRLPSHVCRAFTAKKCLVIPDSRLRFGQPARCKPLSVAGSGARWWGTLTLQELLSAVTCGLKVCEVMLFISKPSCMEAAKGEQGYIAKVGGETP